MTIPNVIMLLRPESADPESDLHVLNSGICLSLLCNSNRTSMARKLMARYNGCFELVLESLGIIA